MGNEKRQRKKANRAARLEIEQKAARRRNLIRRIVVLAAITVGVLVLALLYSLFAADEDDGAARFASSAPALVVPVAIDGIG